MFASKFLTGLRASSWSPKKGGKGNVVEVINDVGIYRISRNTLPPKIMLQWKMVSTSPIESLPFIKAIFQWTMIALIPTYKVNHCDPMKHTHTHRKKKGINIWREQRRMKLLLEAGNIRHQWFGFAVQISPKGQTNPYISDCIDINISSTWIWYSLFAQH